LVRTPEGLRCSVDAGEVRPFWGRAGLSAAAALLALYLLGAAGVYATLKGIGYEVGLTAVVWPGKWPEIRTAQERLHALRAQEAMAAGNYSAAILSLETVVTLNPRNRPAALALANLWQISGRAVLADSLYNRLLDEFPERRAEIEGIWFRSLIARADHTQIQRLAGRFLREEGPGRPAWLHGLFFSTRQTGNHLVLAELLASPRGLPDWCVELIGIEHALQTETDAARALERLTRAWPEPPTPYVPYYQVERLTALGRPQEALAVLDRYSGQLSPEEAAFLRLDAYARLGWDSLVATELGTLLAYPLHGPLVARFCAHFLRHPDRALHARFADRLVREGPKASPESFPVFAALLLTSARCGDPERMAYVGEIIRRDIQVDSRALLTLAGIVQRDEVGRRLDLLLPSVPLPTEVMYALLERYHRRLP
jgi:tetratricopeptide (TPR) repeat protein